MLLQPCLQSRENYSKGGQQLTFTIARKLVLIGEIEERILAPMLVRLKSVGRIKLPIVSIMFAKVADIVVEYYQVQGLNAC